MKKICLNIALLVVVLSLFPLIVFASNEVKISPMRLTLTQDKLIGNIRLTNMSTAPMIFQVDVKRWLQQQEKNKYLSTSDIITTPPVFKLLPHKTQIIRVGLLAIPQDVVERAYRLTLRQAHVVMLGKKNSGLSILLNIVLPVFVEPVGTLNKVLNWKAKRIPHDYVRLTVNNVGNVHTLIYGFSVYAVGTKDKLITHQVVLRHLLPLQKMHWTFKLSSVFAQSKRLKIVTKIGQRKFRNYLVNITD